MDIKQNHCFLSQIVLGDIIERPTDIGSSLSDELASYSNENDFHFDVVQGDTMCCDDFYEGEFLYFNWLWYSNWGKIKSDLALCICLVGVCNTEGTNVRICVKVSKIVNDVIFNN